MGESSTNFPYVRMVLNHLPTQIRKNKEYAKYAVPINEYIQAHRESDAKKRLKRSAPKVISRNLSCLRYLKKCMTKYDKKVIQSQN